MTAKVTRKGSFLSLGKDAVRIEEGPCLVTETATKELLHDDQTASHYYEGVRDAEYIDALGNPYTVPQVGRDALGKVIKVGKPMSYLDHGGNQRPASRCLYIYKRRDIDPTVPVLENGDENPHFVPAHVRDGALLADDDTPPNRTHFTYVYDEVDTLPIGPDGYEAAEKEAIARAEKLIEEDD